MSNGGLIYWTDIPNIHPAVEGFRNSFFIGSKESYADAAVGAEMARHRYYLMGDAGPFEEFFGKQGFARRVKEKYQAGFCVHHILITLPADSIVSAISYMFDIMPTWSFSLSPKKSRQVPQTRILIPESSRA